MTNFFDKVKNSPYFLEIVFVFAIVLLILAHKVSIEGMVGVS